MLDFEGPIQGREAGEPAGAATDEIRAVNQRQGGKGTRPDDSAHSPRACRRGDRIESPAALIRLFASDRRGGGLRFANPPYELPLRPSFARRADRCMLGRV